MEPLITVSELQAITNDVVVCDIRWALLDRNKGHATYLEGHIPGAIYVDLDRDLADPPNGGRHPLPSEQDFATTLGRLGIAPHSHVVVYDDMGNTISARMWWMLRSIGHDTVQVLDGGFQAWVEAGLPIEASETGPVATTYPIRSFGGYVDHDQLHNRLIVDVRASERYRGDHEPVDAKPGHIPGAVNIPTTEHLTHAGTFRSPQYLAETFSRFDDTTPVLSCGSGVNACHTALAMAAAGHDLPDIYIGSYSEWSALDKPVNTGDEP